MIRLSLAGSIADIRLDIVVALAIAVGVEHERRPALRLRRIAGLVKHFGVDPAGHRAGAAEPQRVVGVVAELQMMGAKAGVDEAILHRLGIEHRHLARRFFQREYLCRRVIGALLAERRIVHAAHGGRQPDPALLVEHRVMVVGARIPEFLLAPIGRRHQRLDAGGVSRTQRFRHLGIGNRHLEERDLVGLRVKDRHVVGGIFRRAVKRPLGVDRRIAPVRRDQVVQIFVRRRPFP